ncbi:CD9 antigen [Zootermopsis nevadensis]|uniref:CD9 antigen n=2 Tax=Zootermopsis nevadensis TaxID=136037 RepID=A0A067RDH7_ZOONE|nr:CD9 antigen [Zootermopsis nevadensis]
MGYGQEMDGCGQCMKYSMFIANFIIFVGGISVLGIGIWTLVDKSFMNELLGTNLFLGAVYILIATGAIISLIAFFGCLGALKEIKCMLLTVRKFLL